VAKRGYWGWLCRQEVGGRRPPRWPAGTIWGLEVGNLGQTVLALRSGETAWAAGGSVP